MPGELSIPGTWRLARKRLRFEGTIDEKGNVYFSQRPKTKSSMDNNGSHNGHEENDPLKTTIVYQNTEARKTPNV